jgi:hypothetical protein
MRAREVTAGIKIDLHIPKNSAKWVNFPLYGRPIAEYTPDKPGK